MHFAFLGTTNTHTCNMIWLVHVISHSSIPTALDIIGGTWELYQDVLGCSNGDAYDNVDEQKSAN